MNIRTIVRSLNARALRLFFEYVCVYVVYSYDAHYIRPIADVTTHAPQNAGEHHVFARKRVI